MRTRGKKKYVASQIKRFNKEKNMLKENKREEITKNIEKREALENRWQMESGGSVWNCRRILCGNSTVT